jgi:hypothetical protein
MSSNSNDSSSFYKSEWRTSSKPTRYTYNLTITKKANKIYKIKHKKKKKKKRSFEVQQTIGLEVAGIYEIVG